MKTAFFPPRTLSHLPADNLEALAALCAEFERFDGHARQMPEQHDDYVEALSIVRAFAAARDAKIEPLPDMVPQRHQNIANIAAYFTRLRNTVRTELGGRHSRGYFESKTEEYLTLFAKSQVYEFSDAAFKRLNELIPELRELIGASSLITEDHKRRLLRRLEAARNELYKKTSDIDRFWGFLGEAAIVTRKFGADLEPISDRALEAARIVLGVIWAREGIKALPELSRLLLDASPESAPGGEGMAAAQGEE